MSAVAVQFALTPNFSHLAFGDDAKASEALVHVLRARSIQDDKKNSRLVQLASKLGADTVGQLRQMTDHDWKKLDIPAMCKVYLKYAVRQSKRKGSGPKGWLDKLADDFNYGQPFDMSLYTNHLQMLDAMGFKNEQAMTALVITENKGIEGALEILFRNDRKLLAQKRKEAMERLGRRAPNIAGAGGDPKVMESLKNQIVAEQNRRQKVELDLRNSKSKARLDAYKMFLTGMTSGDQFGVLMFQAWKNYRKKHSITDQEHKLTLGVMGITEEDWKNMQNFEQKDKRDTECVVCLDRPKDHVVMPCMHMCLCDECAEDWSANSKAKCPICSKKVKKVMKIFL